MEPACKLLTAADFLAACPQDRRHYQLFDSVMVAMAPGQAQQIIHMNPAFELGASPRAHHPACRRHAEADIAPAGLHGRDHFVADLAFTCAPPVATRGIVYLLEQPGRVGGH